MHSQDDNEQCSLMYIQSITAHYDNTAQDKLTANSKCNGVFCVNWPFDVVYFK